MTDRGIFAGAGVLLLGWIVVACGEADAGDGPEGRRGPPAMPVDVAAAIRDTAIDEILATGEIEALQQIELRPEVDGRIVRILFREGAEVGRGAPLFKVDDAELTAQVARLEAERDLARQALARTRRLLAEEAASESELEAAEARARSTEADLELAQVRLDRTTVRAPFAGVTGERLVSLGDYVTSSTPLVTLQTVDPQRAAFEVPERYAARLEVGQTVSFRVAAAADRVFEGTVDFVDPVVRLPARTIVVKAVVPNRDRALQSGMFIEARLATEVRPDAVLVPEDAILTLEMGSFVWVITVENTATRRPVLLGIRTPGLVEILEGVEAGETIVVGGLERLFEGASVMPLPSDRATQPLESGPPGQQTPSSAESPPEGEVPSADARSRDSGQEPPRR